MIIIHNNHVIVNDKVIPFKFTVTRKIFRDDTIIVKLDFGNDDPIEYDQGISEYNFYNERLEPCDRQYFQPIIDIGYRCVAQEIIKFKRGRRTKKSWNIVIDMMIKYNLPDMHESNWGIREDGQVIIFDYGYAKS